MSRFSLEVTPAVKKEEGWEVTALAAVLYGNRPPDPPEEIVFVVNGEEFERTETNPESGIARSVMILQSGGYIVTAIRPRTRANDHDARRTRSFAIRGERELTEDEKKLADLKAKVKLAEAEKELKKPTRDEKRTVVLKARLERVKAEKELEKAERKEIPHPTDFTVEKFGSNGKYKLSVSVFSKEKPESVGVGVPEAVVTVVDRHTGQSWGTKTGSGGTVIFEVPEFMEREKIITVTVESLPFVKDRQLLGPRTPARP